MYGYRHSSFIFMLSFTRERYYKQLKHDKTMVTLVYGKTTAIYTSIMMSGTYVACRTKWRRLTCAYRPSQMLDPDWSVDLSIIYLV